MLSKKDKKFLHFYMTYLDITNRRYRKSLEHYKNLSEYQRLQLLQYFRYFFNSCMRVIYKGLGKDYGL